MNQKRFMKKIFTLSFGFIFLLAAAIQSPAQTNAIQIAANQAVLRQAETLTLRQKLMDAKSAISRGDLEGAAKLYDEAWELVKQIGSGIPEETQQTESGLAATRLELARRAENQGDLITATMHVNDVLRMDPQNADALALKQQIEQMTVKLRGQIPDQKTLQQVPYILNDQTNANTLVRDGKLLYEMGKLEDARAKLEEALKLDPDNEGAYYYLNLITQADYERQELRHTEQTQKEMQRVEQAWVPPETPDNIPTVANPYARTNLIFTSPGRQAIVSKLERIHLDSVSWPDGLPLSEVLLDLTKMSKLRDPSGVGINFLWNPNESESGGAAATAAEGANGALDQGNPLPLPTPGAGGGGGETGVDPNSINVQLTMNDVSLGDLLDAIVMVANHPIKYSIVDYGIVFSSQGPETPQLYSRVFRVDPNTFYQGLVGVGVGNANNLSGNNNNNNGGRGNNNNNNNNNNGGGYNNGGGNNGGGNNGRNNNNNNNNGGGGGSIGVSVADVDGLTRVMPMQTPGGDVIAFFGALGVHLDQAGESVFFNDRLGLLYVRATEQDLDTIESAIEVMNQIPPQIHVKARFIEVEQDDNAALGFDWYVGQVGTTVTVSGGSEASQNVPVSAANPLGVFPGNTTASEVAGAATDQQIFNSGLTANSTLATVTGILTDPNFRVVLHALETRSGYEDLAEPEVTVISGRQTEMRATTQITYVSYIDYDQGTPAGINTTPITTTTP